MVYWGYQAKTRNPIQGYVSQKMTSLMTKVMQWLQGMDDTDGHHVRLEDKAQKSLSTVVLLRTVQKEVR